MMRNHSTRGNRRIWSGSSSFGWSTLSSSNNTRFGLVESARGFSSLKTRSRPRSRSRFSSSVKLKSRLLTPTRLASATRRSSRPPQDTCQHPPSYSWAKRCPYSTAKAVLPMPSGPLMTVSRPVFPKATISRSRLSSVVRPTKWSFRRSTLPFVSINGRIRLISSWV